jgi:hypothetical protein
MNQRHLAVLLALDRYTAPNENLELVAWPGGVAGDIRERAGAV